MRKAVKFRNYYLLFLVLNGNLNIKMNILDNVIHNMNVVLSSYVCVLLHIDHIVYYGIACSMMTANLYPHAQSGRHRTSWKQLLHRYVCAPTGYSKLQSTKPQTIGYALNDSPVGEALSSMPHCMPWNWSCHKSSC